MPASAATTKHPSANIVRLPEAFDAGAGRLSEVVRLDGVVLGTDAPRGKPEAFSAPVLCYTAAQTAEVLQISSTTLWRLEKTGQLVPLPDLRHKRYPVEWVQRYASGEPPHPSMARIVAQRKAAPKKATHRSRYVALERVPEGQSLPVAPREGQAPNNGPISLVTLATFINKAVKRLEARGSAKWDGKPMQVLSPEGVTCTFTWDISHSLPRPAVVLVSATRG